MLISVKDFNLLGENISSISYNHKDNLENFVSTLFDEITRHAINDKPCTLMIDKDTCKELAKDWDNIKWIEIY